jgi:hypothetical protein
LQVIFDQVFLKWEESARKIRVQSRKEIGDALRHVPRQIRATPGLLIIRIPEWTNRVVAEALLL